MPLLTHTQCCYSTWKAISHLAWFTGPDPGCVVFPQTWARTTFRTAPVCLGLGWNDASSIHLNPSITAVGGCSSSVQVLTPRTAILPLFFQSLSLPTLYLSLSIFPLHPCPYIRFFSFSRLHALYFCIFSLYSSSFLFWMSVLKSFPDTEHFGCSVVLMYGTGPHSHKRYTLCHWVHWLPAASWDVCVSNRFLHFQHKLKGRNEKQTEDYCVFFTFVQASSWIHYRTSSQSAISV